MFDVGGGEILLIALAILLLFGPEKLPELLRSFGRGMSHLRKAQTEFQRNLNAMADEIHEVVQQDSNTTQSHSPYWQHATEADTTQFASIPPSTLHQPHALYHTQPQQKADALPSSHTESPEQQSLDKSTLPPTADTEPI
ncbi:MAG: twin-arginine translocase TatA/TatE family subunit [Bacteroidota bacterium]|nr:twin-arginine translocase TatA/TatE family subunit [Candidatus Kapabacteria bacterium]MDW8220866.1 twin-arginine translocase TatA/TatE family subunit [Bacteroidota bacterium]